MSQAVSNSPRARAPSPVDSGPAFGGAVEVNVNYLVPPLGRHSVTVAPLGTGDAERTGEYARTPVTIHDGRAARRPAMLDGEGFTLGRQSSAVEDFSDDDEVRAVYYPEMQQLVQRATRAREVLVFDHNIRIDGGLRTENGRVPVRVVHNDYTEKSGPWSSTEPVSSSTPSPAGFGRRGEAVFSLVRRERLLAANKRRQMAGTMQFAAKSRSCNDPRGPRHMFG